MLLTAPSLMARRRRVTVEQVQQVAEFRNRLVEHMNLVMDRESRYDPLSDHNMSRIRAEQPWLSQTYGRLRPIIHPSGWASGGPLSRTQSCAAR